ncbi:MAG: flagellar motor protein MotB [Pirellulaceae bacterium]|nr:flagellar motor protein MotB [Planctomycetales bacterium]
MAREQAPEEPQSDVPIWFLTYSDVITLLMTFFILLLTFATTEPERFEQMQVTLFGGGGATGVAGKSAGPLDKDSILLRVRPTSGRITNRGSETPPIDSDPTLETLSAGLESLEQQNTHDPSATSEITMQLSLLIDSQANVTSAGAQRMRMFAKQLRKGPFVMSLSVGRDEDVAAAMTLALYVVEKEGIPCGKVGVTRSFDDRQTSELTVVFSRQFGE